MDRTQWLAGEQLSDLMPQEHDEVKRALIAAGDLRFHPTHVHNILGARAAAALCSLAEGMLREMMEFAADPELQADSETQQDLQQCKNRAVWLSKKATDLYPHPVLFARLARVLKSAGRTAEAEMLLESQRKREEAWVKKYTDEFLMLGLSDENQFESEP